MSDALDQIAAEGAALDQGAAGALGLDQQPAAPAVDPDQEGAAFWALVPKTMGSIICMAFPELREVYAEDKCLAWGSAMQAVAKKRGWNVVNSPEAILAAASLVFVIPTSMTMIKHAQERKARARAAASPGAASGAGPAPGGSATLSDAAPPNINDQAKP